MEGQLATLMIQNIHFTDQSICPSHSFLFGDILLPLTKLWTHGSLIHGIGEHIEIFKPDVGRKSNVK